MSILKRLQEMTLTESEETDAVTVIVSNKKKKSPGVDLICPITLELPWDPVMAEDGRIYDRPAIEEHFKKQDARSLMTNVKVGKLLVPAPQIKSLIETLIETGAIDGDLASTWNEKVNEQSMKALLTKAEGGDAQAMHMVGCCYRHGANGFQKDRKLALISYNKAHLAGSVKTTARLGYFLCQGLGCTQGVMYLGIAATQGSDYAAFHLGMAWAKGSCGLGVNKDEAIYWLQMAIGFHDCSEPIKYKAQKMLDTLRPPATASDPLFAAQAYPGRLAAPRSGSQKGKFSKNAMEKCHSHAYASIS